MTTDYETANGAAIANPLSRKAPAFKFKPGQKVYRVSQNGWGSSSHVRIEAYDKRVQFTPAVISECYNKPHFGGYKDGRHVKSWTQYVRFVHDDRAVVASRTHLLSEAQYEVLAEEYEAAVAALKDKNDEAYQGRIALIQEFIHWAGNNPTDAVAYMEKHKLLPHYRICDTCGFDHKTYLTYDHVPVAVFGIGGEE